MRLTNLRSCFSPRLRAVETVTNLTTPHFPDCLVKTRLGEHGWGRHLVTFFAVSSTEDPDQGDGKNQKPDPGRHPLEGIHTCNNDARLMP